MVEKTRVVLVDDHPLLREGVAAALANEPDFEVVGQGDDADAAIRLAQDLMPDVMVLDISMPGGGGLRAARAIADIFPVIKIIMLTVSESEEDVLGAFKAGARGYVLKGVGGSEIVRIVRAILAREPCWAKRVTPQQRCHPRPISCRNSRAGNGKSWNSWRSARATRRSRATSNLLRRLSNTT
jgi:DNA-binding NarL/FixJ family response regulator